MGEEGLAPAVGSGVSERSVGAFGGILGKSRDGGAGI